MMEMLRSLIKEKEQAAGPGSQSDVAQPDQRRDEPTYPPGFTPPFAKMLSMPQMGGFPYGYAPPSTNE